MFSRRDVWRLFSLLLGTAMVAFLIRELGRPQVAAGVDQVMAVAATPVAEEPAIKPPLSPPADPAQFRHLLDLAGWNTERFASLDKGKELSEADRQALLELLWRLRTFDGPQLVDWARQGEKIESVLSAPNEHTGDLVAIAGHVTTCKRLVLPAELAARLEMPAYYECELALPDNAGVANIITGRVPNAWLEMQPLDEPASAAGVFIRMLPDANETRTALFVSPEIAWHPNTPREPFVSLGKSVLGELGVDVGLLDGIRQRRSISGQEREAFYQMLNAAGKLGSNQLTRFATRNLESTQQHWSEVAKDGDPTKQRIAQEVVARAAKGVFSVAPLFNDPANQVGELISLQGIVRRVQRIDVGRASDGTPSDVARRFGIDHYYEIDLFTDDSQNNPVVFCVRELPPGMPIGDRLDVPVRVAGFFFKSWGFESIEAILPTAPDGSPTPKNLRQFAPLLIGRGPIMLEQPAVATAGDSFGWIAAAICVGLLGTIWAAGWWLAREDRRFIQSTLAKQFSVPEGESLNDLQFDLSESGREHE